MQDYQPLCVNRKPKKSEKSKQKIKKGEEKQEDRIYNGKDRSYLT